MNKYYIKTEDWEKIYEFLKTRTDIRVKNEEKTRSFAEGVYFIMRTGSQWRELPPSYGKWRSVINALKNGLAKVYGFRF